ncbi:MAG: hypothetical protein WB789_04475 [Thermoplasmata archaeon]
MTSGQDTLTVKVVLFGASGTVGRAMFKVAKRGALKPLLETRDINHLAT